MAHIVNGGEKLIEGYEASWIDEVSGIISVLPEVLKLKRVYKSGFAFAWHRR